MTPTAQRTLDMLLGDFEDLWLAVAHYPGLEHRGNCLFASHIYTIWEFACRERSLVSFRDALVSVDSRYADHFERLRYSIADLCGPYENETFGFSGPLDASNDPWTPQFPAPAYNDHLTIKGSLVYVRTDELYQDTKEALKLLELC